MADSASVSAFKVCDVEVGTKRHAALEESAYDPRKSESPRKSCYWREHAPGYRVRHVSPLPENAVDLSGGYEFHKNMFARAVLTAYSDHLPLRLSPDVVWFTIAQGLARHVNENSDELRSKFVAHEGKQEIALMVPPGISDAGLLGVIPAFASEISRRTLDDVADIVVPDFSTSTVLSKMCTRVTLMDAMQTYFTYACRTLCGIPEITLTGTAEDWRSVRHRASELSKYNLEWWTASLLPILDELVQAVEGTPDRVFFQKMVNRRKIGAGSGSYVKFSGWFQEFFPYIVVRPGKHKRNPYLGKWNINEASNVEASSIEQRLIPSGISSVPFTLDEKPMKFYGGLTCLTQDPENGTVEAHFGMAVAEEEE